MPEWETNKPVQCPHCGQVFDLMIDTTQGTQEFTTECEICCRPFDVVVQSEPGEILSLETKPE
jgi:hypothetical protein